MAESATSKAAEYRGGLRVCEGRPRVLVEPRQAVACRAPSMWSSEKRRKCLAELLDLVVAVVVVNRRAHDSRRQPARLEIKRRHEAWRGSHVDCLPSEKVGDCAWLSILANHLYYGDNLDVLPVYIQSRSVCALLFEFWMLPMVRIVSSPRAVA